MAKAIVIYESKWGNTKKVADAIIEGMAGLEVIQKEIKEVTPQEAAGYDVIILGSPNHMGGQVGSIKKFIDELGKLNVKGKYAAVFDTYMMMDVSKAVNKMEKQIADKVPGLKLAAPGLSVKVGGMKGPIVEGELPRAKEFGEKIAKAIK